MHKIGTCQSAGCSRSTFNKEINKAYNMCQSAEIDGSSHKRDTLARGTIIFIIKPKVEQLNWETFISKHQFELKFEEYYLIMKIQV